MAEGPWLQVFFPAATDQIIHDQIQEGFSKIARSRSRSPKFGRRDSCSLQQHRQIRLFLGLNSRLAEIREAYGPRYGFAALPVEQAEEAFKLGCQMAQLHAMLVHVYKDTDRKLFNLKTKTRFVLHSLHLSKFIHPAMASCYKGESTMHRMQTVWKSCLPGVKHWHAAKKAALKERYLLWLQHKISTG